jgi:hypothetical protein
VGEGFCKNFRSGRLARGAEGLGGAARIDPELVCTIEVEAASCCLSRKAKQQTAAATSIFFPGPSYTRFYCRAGLERRESSPRIEGVVGARIYNAVPEPARAALLLGSAGFPGARRRKSVRNTECIGSASDEGVRMTVTPLESGW